MQVGRKECTRLLMEFIESGDLSQVATAAGTIVAYIAKLDDTEAQVEALEDLRRDLVERCGALDMSGEAQDRHVAIEDAIEQAGKALKGEAS